MNSSLSTRLSRHMLACSAVAAIGAAVGVGQQAQAAIVYSGVLNYAIPGNIDGIYVNVQTGATGTSGSGTPGWDINRISAATRSSPPRRATAPSPPAAVLRHSAPAPSSTARPPPALSTAERPFRPPDQAPITASGSRTAPPRCGTAGPGSVADRRPPRRACCTNTLGKTPARASWPAQAFPAPARLPCWA